MNTLSLHFDYERFVSLSGDSLVEYADPFANATSVFISEEDLEQLMKHLDEYDEYHLVYALEIGTDNSPETFSPAVPRFLASETTSVYCAADRVLRRLDRRFVTTELLSSVESVIDNASHERKRCLKDLLNVLTKSAM